MDSINLYWTGHWRREWDSNPRYSLKYTRFPSVRLKPLGHLSGGVVCPLESTIVGGVNPRERGAMRGGEERWRGKDEIVYFPARTGL